MDLELSSINNISITIYSNLRKLVTCKNCKFSREETLTEFNIICSRSAKYKDNIKLNCSMYLYKGK